MPHSPGLGAIYGIVAENGVPQAGSPLWLIDRTTARVIRKATTQADGGFAFSGLSLDTTDYMVIAVDETGDGIVEPGQPEPTDPYKNALIQDRIRPVPVHMGTYYPAAWFTKVAEWEPALLFPAPYYDTVHNELPLLSAGGGKQIAVVQTGSVSFGELTPFEDGAFSLPAIELTDTAWLHLQGGSGQKIKGVFTSFSLVAVVDFSRPWGFTQRALIQWGTGATSFKSVSRLCHVSFNGTNQIRVGFNTWSSQTTSAPWAAINERVYTQTLTAPTSWALVAIEFKSSSFVKLFVDGTMYELDTTTVPASIAYTEDTYPILLADAGLSGEIAGAPATGPRFAFYCATNKLISEEDLNTAWDRLVNGGFPSETGFARSVIADLPALYYRMDEYDSLGTFYTHNGLPEEDKDPLLWGTPVGRTLLLSPGGRVAIAFENSPVVGRSAALFDGTFCAYQQYSYGSLLNYRNFTIAFWLQVRVVSGTRGTQYILRSTEAPTDPDVYRYELYLTSEIKLALNFPNAGSVVFDYVFSEVDPTTDYLDGEGLPVIAPGYVYVAIVINKSNEQALLYINGSFEESKPVSATSLQTGIINDADNTQDALNQVLYTSGGLTVGGSINGVTVSNCLIGALAELQLYTYPLSALRIADHYANKDVL